MESVSWIHSSCDFLVRSLVNASDVTIVCLARLLVCLLERSQSRYTYADIHKGTCVFWMFLHVFICIDESSPPSSRGLLTLVYSSFISQAVGYCWRLYSADVFMFWKMHYISRYNLELIAVNDVAGNTLSSLPNPGTRSPTASKWPKRFCFLEIHLRSQFSSVAKMEMRVWTTHEWSNLVQSKLQGSHCIKLVSSVCSGVYLL